MAAQVKYYVYYTDKHGDSQVDDVWVPAGASRAFVVGMFEDQCGDDYSEIVDVVIA